MSRLQEVLQDPAASYWIKKAIRELLDKDPVDAASDVDLLAELMTEHCDQLLGLEKSTGKKTFVMFKSQYGEPDEQAIQIVGCAPDEVETIRAATEQRLKKLGHESIVYLGECSSVRVWRSARDCFGGHPVAFD